MINSTIFYFRCKKVFFKGLSSITARNNGLSVFRALFYRIRPKFQLLLNIPRQQFL